MKVGNGDKNVCKKSPPVEAKTYSERQGLQRNTEEPAKASAGQHWTRRDNSRHVLYAYCVCKPHKTFSQRHYQPSARFLEEF